MRYSTHLIHLRAVMLRNVHKTSMNSTSWSKTNRPEAAPATRRVSETNFEAIACGTVAFLCVTARLKHNRLKREDITFGRHILRSGSCSEKGPLPIPSDHRLQPVTTPLPLRPVVKEQTIFIGGALVSAYAQPQSRFNHRRYFLQATCASAWRTPEPEPARVSGSKFQFYGSIILSEG